MDNGFWLLIVGIAVLWLGIRKLRYEWQRPEDWQKPGWLSKYDDWSSSKFDLSEEPLSPRRNSAKFFAVQTALACTVAGILAIVVALYKLFTGA